MRTGSGGFASLFKDPIFSSNIIGVIFDEAHCISQWSSFRPDYKEIGRLQSVLPDTTFHITSATFPEYIKDEVLETLNISNKDLFIVHRSNRRTNVAIVVREIKSSLISFDDLDFLVQDWASGGPPPPRFLILFDSISECVKATSKLRFRLLDEDKDKIMWHHSDMSPEYRAETLEAFRRHEIVGFCATDTLGMVLIHFSFI